MKNSKNSTGEKISVLINNNEANYGKVHDLSINPAPFIKTLHSVIKSESAKPFNDIHDVVHEIFNASSILADEYWQPYVRTGMSEDEKKRHLEERKKYERIYWRHSKDDPLSSRIESAIDTIENLAQSITQEKQSLYSLLTTKIWKISNKNGPVNTVPPPVVPPSGDPV